ncbi:MAG TPA: 50S ribosomal protein L5 [Candidatus Saccharimonadales bacterium]|nr:50S ribosomal protein L5 [Candidatus Saccharimonadales bacterium]
MERLHEKYLKELAPKLKSDLGLKNVMQVPRLKKISINTGIGAIKDNKDLLESFTDELTELTGQKPYIRKARVSEAGFKIKKGDIVGLTVTLRSERMWAFLDKFINIVLPRVRDFRGLSTTSFDNSGNYSTGIREHVIFPEINPNVVKSIRSLQVTIVTSSNDVDRNRALFAALGMPFSKGEGK